MLTRSQWLTPLHKGSQSESLQADTTSVSDYLWLANLKLDGCQPLSQAKALTLYFNPEVLFLLGLEKARSTQPRGSRASTSISLQVYEDDSKRCSLATHSYIPCGG